MNIMDAKAIVRGGKGKVAAAAVASDAPIADVRAALDERRTALAALRGELAGIERQIAEIRAARLLDEPVDLAALGTLGERREALQGTIAEAAEVVSGLQLRVDVFDAATARREYDGLIADLAALSAAAPGMEAEYDQLATALVDLASRMAAAGQRFDTIRMRVAALEAQHGFRAARTRRPHAALTIDERWLLFPSEPKAFAHCWAHRTALLAGWAGRERSPEPAPMDTSPAKRMFRVLRRRVMPPGEGGLHREYREGTVEELPSDFAAWLERDSPGTLEAV